MSGPHSDRIVDGYLARLRAAQVDLPRPRQEELVNDVKGHIAEARAALPRETDADVLNLLDRIGEPDDVAAEARERLGVQPRLAPRNGLLEIGALVLTPLLWPVGVILLWTSSAWKTRDKCIGTLLPPGGYLGLFFLIAALPLTHTVGGTICRQPTDAGGGLAGSPACQNFGPPPAPGWVGWLGGLVFVVLLVLPVLTAIYLGLRLHRGGERAPIPA